MRRAPLVVLLLLAACGTSEPPPPAATALTVPPGAQQATVVRHTDGDTFWLRGIGTGPLHGGAVTKVRVLEIDTPEIHPSRQCYGTEAADRTAELVPIGDRVRVEVDRDRRDRYGRLLLYVWTADGASLEEVLLREGYARVLYVRPNDRHLDHFRAVEDEARRARRGLWGHCS